LIATCSIERTHRNLWTKGAGKTVHANAKVAVEPEIKGLVRAFIDELPSPFDCDSEALAGLPAHDEE
jgi:hypothetical protein